MFTWECPSCGKELNIDAGQCPKCGAQFGEPEEAESIIADPQPSAAPAPPPTASTPPPVPARTATQAVTGALIAAPAKAAPPAPVATPVWQDRPSAPPIQEYDPARTPAPYGIQRKHLAVVLAVLLIAIAGAVYLARPDLFLGRQDIAFEEVPLSDTVGFASAAFGDLQVAGVRPLYTDDLKTRVLFVVINHGETPQAGVSIQAHLSHKDAPLDAPPLASFAVEFNEELAPGESREIETDLMAFSTLAAFPSWNKLRIDLEGE